MMVETMKEDEELEMLLGEIPHATSLSLHHHPPHTNAHHHHFVNGNHHDKGRYDDDYESCGYSQNTCVSPAAAIFPSMFSNEQSSSPEPISKPYIISRNPYSKLPQIQDQNQALLCHNLVNSTSFRDSDYLAANPLFSRIPMSSESEINPAFFGFQQNCWQSDNLYWIPAQIGMNSMDEVMKNVPYMIHSKSKTNPNYDPYRFHMVACGSSNIRITSVGLGLGPGLEGLATCEDSLIIQGEDASGVRKKLVRPCSSHLTQIRRYIFAMAKDQHGCRLLQKIFDDGNPQHVQIVFDEVIGHVVELMINPFGNYLMQKLLEVCNEEQRMRILTAITREPKELVQISLNTHGTRVVQKLIETLKTRLQVKLVISAIEPGFLALINDLNGNHVIQRCLQCLSHEDNKFIFEAAAKFCVEIATHQHGCCVLQRCINHSIGDYREKLVSEVSGNGLILAQDAFGNYVVQYVLELQIPSAVSKLTAQFKGNYVRLATQKFSSHVVEKCLAILDGQIRSTIICELISATHFEQLLQDPHANYVVQTALCVSEGALHNSLVNVIESHKAISRNSPYSKRIFSHNLLRM